MEIKDIISNRRNELRLTMKELSEKVGVSEATICRWERGDIATMKQTKIKALADALKITPSMLVPGLSPQTVVSKTATTAPEQRHLEKYRRLTVDNRTKLDNYMDGLLYEQEDYFQKREQQYSTS